MQQFAGLIGTATAAGGPAFAEDFPRQNITVIVPFAPGGGPDKVLRLVADKARDAFKRPMIIDYKPGATGLIGTNFVKNARADGYTLLFNSNAGMVIAPLLRQPAPFDALKDFAPLTTVLRNPMVLTIPADRPANTLQEFVARAKSAPMAFASPGIGSVAHLTAELLARRAGISMTHVPFKGLGEAQNAVVSGAIDLFPQGPHSAVELVRGGKLKAVAVTGDKRIAALPGVPSMAEAGYPDIDMQVWTGFFAAKMTPDDVVEKLANGLINIVRTAELREAVSQEGLAEAMGNTPQEMAQLILDETPRWARLIEELKIRIE